MNWTSVLVSLLLLLASGATGSLVLLYRSQRLRTRERAYGLDTPNLRQIGAGIGAATGLAVGALILYFAVHTNRFDLIEWVGRSSYLLVAGASGGHIFVLVYAAIHIVQEERAWKNGSGRGKPREGTLGRRRLEQLRDFSREYGHYTDLKSRDDEVVDDLTGVLGGPLVNTRHDLARIPFYGYLGTVCGILLMAQELGHIGETTEPFEVLRSMAKGLVLAFQTTLVALLAFLPLRKMTDYLMRRLGALEEEWTKARDEVSGPARRS
jgi:MFS family permease